MISQMGLGIATAVERLPRIRLLHLPTPLIEAEELSRRLGGPRIFIKRDDMTGFALGGTKGRMLEFHMAVAKQRSCDVVILHADAQSNYSRQLAAAASRLGMKALLLLDASEHQEVQGNLLLDRLLGAEIRLVGHMENMFSDEAITKLDELHEDTVQALRRQGHRPLVIDKWYRPSIWSVVGAITCGLELSTQLSEAKLSADYVFVAVGSGATYAGLLVGVRACGLATKVAGVTITEKREELRSAIVSRAHEAAEFLGVEVGLSPDEIALYEEYAGAGYGIPSAQGNQAIALLAQTEGIFLDPVYTGKAMSGLIDQVRGGRIGGDKTVVFLHTGGTPALFAYSRELADC